MRHIRQLLCTCALVLAGLGATSPSAQADTPGCVNRGEYRQVHKGMTKRRVHQIFDTRGRRVAFSRNGRFTSEIRRYRACPRRSAVSVGYGNRRVRSKSAVWGR